MKIAVNEGNFKSEVLSSDVPVLVDFWAQWCMPCKMIEPVVAEIAKEYEGKMKVCSIDIDQAQGLAAQYSVMSIPTLALFKGGKVVEKVVGALPKAAIMEKVLPYIS
ncbi:MAG: thioredoxin [Elusimicrobia bacterium]|nr:thioredoxin [Elusimicrobiota bacterium]